MMIDSRRYYSRTSAFGNFDRNRFWPLYLWILLGTPFYISEQYFRSDANCEEISFRRNGKRALSLLNTITAWKQQFNENNNLSSFRKELANEPFRNCEKNCTVCFENQQWFEIVNLGTRRSWYKVSSILRLPFYSQITFCFITLEVKKDTKIKFQKLIDLYFFYKILSF